MGAAGRRDGSWGGPSDGHIAGTICRRGRARIALSLLLLLLAQAGGPRRATAADAEAAWHGPPVARIEDSQLFLPLPVANVSAQLSALHPSGLLLLLAPPWCGGCRRLVRQLEVFTCQRRENAAMNKGNIHPGP